MTALEILRRVHSYGGRVSLGEGGKLVLEAPAPLPDDLRMAIREHKPSIMVALGAPLDAVISEVLADIRPFLPEAMKQLSDEKILVLVNWGIIGAWEHVVSKAGKS